MDFMPYPSRFLLVIQAFINSFGFMLVLDSDFERPYSYITFFKYYKNLLFIAN